MTTLLYFFIPCVFNNKIPKKVQYMFTRFIQMSNTFILPVIRFSTWSKGRCLYIILVLVTHGEVPRYRD
jgi:hypothetical protein